jgi:hypothetical protein
MKNKGQSKLELCFILFLKLKQYDNYRKLFIIS